MFTVSIIGIYYLINSNLDPLYPYSSQTDLNLKEFAVKIHIEYLEAWSNLQNKNGIGHKNIERLFLFYLKHGKYLAAK